MTCLPEPRCVAFSARETCPGPAFLPTQAGVFPFIGTAAEHLERVRHDLEHARANHAPVAKLLRRRKVLVARCAALGVRDV